MACRRHNSGRLRRISTFLIVNVSELTLRS
jgi:hypothetical protein